MLKYPKFLLRTLNRQPSFYMCSCSTAISINRHHESNNTEPPAVETEVSAEEIPYMPTSKKKLLNHFKRDLQLFKMLPYIPQKYFKLKARDRIENMYLVDSKIAKHAVSLILPLIRENNEQVVCETNAGLGLISSELLDNGWPLMRLYETCPDFRAALKEFNSVYPGRIELFSKDIYHAYSLKYLDNIDKGRRIDQLLRDVPRKNWSDDHVMTIIGPMPNSKFIKYLIRTLIIQTDLAQYGRPQVFAFMVPKDYIVLTANANQNLHTYQYWSVLFNLLFDYKLLHKYSRKSFLPWEQNLKINDHTRYASKIDIEYTYFVQFEFKKDLPVEPDKLLHLFYFVKHFFGKGKNVVIPTMEKWFPGFGLNLFLPQCEHDGKFPKNLDLYSTFGQLHPEEILCVFKEFINHPHYEHSPFLNLIDSHLIKSETVESDMVVEGELDKDTVEELEEKFIT